MKKRNYQISVWGAAFMAACSLGNSASALTYDTNTTHSSSPAWSENVTINSGVTVTLGQNVLIGQTKDITIDLNGTLVMNSAKTDNHGAGNSFINGNNKAIQFTGTGTLVHNGTGRLAMQSNGYKGAGGYSIKFAFSDGALIDIQKGTLVNGGWNQQNWNDNKADLRIASGANLDLWDGSNMKVDSLVGSGTITSGSTASRFVDFGLGNSTWIVNGKQQTPEFSGTIASGKNIHLHKYGTGTQILSGAYLSNGTAYISGGTLQIGNGTKGYIGTSSGVEVRENGRLVINSAQITSLRKGFTGAGVVDVTKGTLEILNSTAFTGTMNVANGGLLALGTVDELTNVTTADGAKLALYVSSTDTTGFTLDTFNAEKAARANATVQFFAPYGKTLTTADTGDYLKGTTSVGVQVSNGGTLMFDNGADSVTTIASQITTGGTAVINSGKVVVNSATPANGNARFDFSKITVNDGGHLLWDGVVARQTRSMTYLVNEGGVLEFAMTGNYASNTTEQAANSLANGSGSVTFNGAGTIRVTGGNYLHAAHGNVQFTMQMDSGGWLEILDGQLVNGGYSKQTWGNNKGSVYIAEGAALNLWNSSAWAHMDGLTGKGYIIRGTSGRIDFGQDNHSTFENNTALFEGTICGSSDNHTPNPNASTSISVRMHGTGTQILAGLNNYTGTTEVQGGTLQFGNGGATGNIGTGNVDIRGGELKFNNTIVNTLNNLNGYGKLTNANSGKVTTAANPENFRGTLNPETENAVIEFAPEEFGTVQLPGNITGKGTVVFRTNAGSTLKMASNSVAKDATVEISGGNITVGDNFDGTLKAAENVTLTMPQNYTGSPYTMTLYENNTVKDGRITPTSDLSDVTVKVYDEKVFDMSQAANNGVSTSVAAYIPNDYSALSYTNKITVLKDLTLDFGGQFDDRLGIWVKPLDADGNPIDGAEWRTLLDYRSDICKWHQADAVTLAAGNYLIDLRVSENGGGQNAQARDAYNDFMGIGLRLNGTSNWFNFDVNTENGFVGLLDGSIVSGTAKTDAVFDGNFDIAEGKTVTFDNPHATMEKYDIDSTVTGKGTLKFTDSANSGVKYDVNIDSEGAIVFAEGVDLAFTVGLENTEPLVSADSVTFEGLNEIFLTLEGDAPEGIDVLTLIETSDADSLVGFDLAALNIIAEDANMRWAPSLANGVLSLTLGNSNSVPEPAAWVLLLAGAFGILKLRRKH